jgi:bifunctional enzyme CysN/CysC
VPGREHAVAALVEEYNGKDLLRVLTCGSVDDGKSTLIGRLLYDAKLVFDDQMRALARDSKRSGTTSEIDFSLLLDGLQAEREQAITIDVAFRHCVTKRRKFIIADSPGHEQYTRNMVTAASNSDAAILLVDARKGLLVQTRRHAYICALLGIRDVVLAVNKMDLCGYEEPRFRAIEADFVDFANRLGLRPAAIPLSALNGENVLERSAQMPWFRGEPLLSHLEHLDVGRAAEQTGFRMAVQLVQRPDHSFRGFSGTVTGAGIRRGDPVKINPSGATSRVARIVQFGGDVEEAGPGTAVTLTLEAEVDVVRGDIIAPPQDSPEVADQFAAHLVWMDASPLLAGRRYLFAIGGQVVAGSITEIKHRIDVNTLEHLSCKKLEMNEVGFCNVALDRLVAFDPYETLRATGAFIVIDRHTNLTSGAGMIAFPLFRGQNLTWQRTSISKADRMRVNHHKPCIMWFTGLSGAGKSTIANEVEMRLHALGAKTYLLDGDNLRHGLNRDLGFTAADRVENVRRVAEVAKLMVDAGLIVLVSLISPYRSERQLARELVEAGEFFEIFVDTPLAVCVDRDPKGLYRKAREGAIRNMTGIDSPYEPPEQPELVLPGADAAPQQLADRVIEMMKNRNVLG